MRTRRSAGWCASSPRPLRTRDGACTPAPTPRSTFRLRWFDENSNQDGKLDEVRFDDAFWAQFNQDYAAWVDKLHK